jgi:hypothetical protein
VRARPDAHRAPDSPAADAFAQLLGERHVAPGLHRRVIGVEAAQEA